MIAVDNQPFTIVNDIGFRRLLSKALPCYKIPSDKFFRQNILPEMYERCKTSLKEKLQDMNSKLSVTTDIWTDQYNNNSFISLTAHWLEKSGSRSSFVLAIKHFPGRHTGNAIAEVLSTILQAWQIEEKVHITIADNAANMRKAMQEAGMLYQPCFIHSIQLVITESLKSQRSVLDVMGVARKIVGHFSHSQLACDKLKVIQEQLNIPVKKLIQDVETRWNSSYYMLERLLEQKRAINLYIADNAGLTDLTFSQWELVNNLVTLLKPFEEITKLASAEDSIISEVIPLVSTLKAYLSQESQSFFGIGTLKDELQNNLHKRFHEIFGKDHLLIATFLDPRFKSKFFNQETEQLVLSSIRKNILQESATGSSAIIQQADTAITISTTRTSTSVEEGLSDDDDENMPLAALSLHSMAKERQEMTNEKKRKNETSFWDSFDNIVGSSINKKKKGESNQEMLDRELLQYMQSTIIPRTDSPFQWWQDHKAEMCLLYRQVEVYFSAPPASVSSERVFSEAGNVYNNKRNKLTPEIAEKLIFLHDNLKRLNFQY